MPSRIIREGILSSERVDALSAGAEIFYRRLMSVVDDYGRFSAKPTLLRSSCYPLRIDLVKDAEISAYLSECVKAGLVRHYSVDGKPFLEMQDFRQQVRAKESKYPSPDSGLQIKCEANAKHSIADDKHPLSNVHLDVFVVEDVIVDGSAAESDCEADASAQQKLPNPAARLAIAMIDSGIQAQSGDPRIIALAAQDVAIETVKAACEEAKRQKPNERISPGLVISIIERWAKQAANVQAVGAASPVRQQAPPWWSSEKGIQSKGNELGLTPRSGESWSEFKSRIEIEIHKKQAEEAA